MPRRNRNRRATWPPPEPVAEPTDAEPTSFEHLARSLVVRGLASPGILEQPWHPAPHRSEAAG